MAVCIRLARCGRKKRPSYRIVAAASKFKPTGRFLEKLGTYDPFSKKIVLNHEALQKWLSTGAKPSTTMERLIKISSAEPAKIKDVIPSAEPAKIKDVIPSAEPAKIKDI